MTSTPRRRTPRPGGPVDNPTRGTHRSNRHARRVSSVFPVVHTPYGLRRKVRREMMETDTAVGSSVRVTVQRDDLSGRLALVSRATSSRGAVQVLGGILLRARDGLVELEATDMELSLRTTVPADVEGEGAASCPRSSLATSSGSCRPSVTIAYRAEDGGGFDRVGLVLVAGQRVRGGGLPTACRRSTCRCRRSKQRRCSRRCSASRAPRRATSPGRC